LVSIPLILFVREEANEGGSYDDMAVPGSLDA